MKKKISKMMFMFVVPVVACLSLGIFLVFGFVSNHASALTQNGGGSYVKNNSTTTLGTDSSISGFSAVNGGGVYVESGGTLILDGGTIFRNTATSGNGHNIYNTSTFTMNGGTIGTSGSSQTGYGIYNTGIMKLYGGTVYDDIYSSSSFTTKISANLNGTISLGDSAKVCVVDYAGVTPEYKINLSSSRGEGTIVTFQGSSTIPDLTKLTITGFNSGSYELNIVKGSSSTEWNIVLRQKTIVVSFDPQGTDENNIFEFDGTFETCTVGSSLSGFLNDLASGGSYAVSNEKAFSGTNSFKIVGGAGNTYGSRLYRGYSAKAGKSYIFEAMVFSDSLNTACLSAELNGGDYTWKTVSSPYTQAGSWQKVVVQTEVLTSDATLCLFVYVNEGVTTFVDQVSVQTSDSVDGGLLKEVVYGETYSTLPTPTRNGYVFNGWFTEKTEGTQVTENSVVSISEDHTLYAHWVLASVDLPSDWRTQVSSTTYMTTTLDSNSLTRVVFETSVPSGYTQIGTLSTGLKVYADSSNTKIAFVNEGSIMAPENSDELFSLKNVETISFNNFDTSKVTVMSSMFSSCSSLESLDLSSFDTSNVKNMEIMFYECSGLTSLDLSNFDTSNVTTMTSMFSGCSGLASLNISNFVTLNVTNISWMFYKCDALTSTNIDLSGLNTSKVTTMEAMFAGCSGLTNLSLSNFNTSNVTNMSSMFYDCSGLTSLGISNFNTSNVTNMKYMFHDCSGLTSLGVSNFNTSKVTDMGGMFSGCTGLTSLKVENFDTSKVTVMSWMFSGCSGLTSLDVRNFVTTNVETMWHMFSGCSSLISLDLSSFNMSEVSDTTTGYDEDMLNFGSTSVLKYLKTPYNSSSVLKITTGSTLYNVSTGSSVTSVPANTTASLTYATKLTITLNANGGSCSESSKTAYYLVPIGTLPTPTRSGYEFTGWYNNGSRVSSSTTFSKDVTLIAGWYQESSGGGTPTVPDDPDPSTEDDGYFPSDWQDRINSNLEDAGKTIDDFEYIMFAFSSFSTDGYTDVGVLNGISYYVSENVYDGQELVFVYDGAITPNNDCSSLFYDLENVKGIVFRNFDTYNVYSFESMFAGCTALEFVDLYSFATPNVSSMEMMFMKCINLKGVYNATFDCYGLESCSRMFESCFSFTGEYAVFGGDGEVSGMPTMTDSYNLANMSEMFYNCTSLTEFSMPYLHTHNVTNAYGMFNGCSALEVLDLSNFILGNSEGTLIDFNPAQLNVLFTPRLANLEQFNCDELVNPYGKNLSNIFEECGLDWEENRPSFSISFVNSSYLSEDSGSRLGIVNVSLESIFNSENLFAGLSNFGIFENYLFDSFDYGNLTLNVYTFDNWLRYYTLPIPWGELNNLKSTEGLSNEEFCGWSTDGGSKELSDLLQSDFLSYRSYENEPQLSLTARFAPDQNNTDVIFDNNIGYDPSNSPFGFWSQDNYCYYHNLRECSWLGYFPTPHLENGEKFLGWQLVGLGDANYGYWSYYKNLLYGENGGDSTFEPVSDGQNNGSNSNGITRPIYLGSTNSASTFASTSGTSEKVVDFEVGENLQAILEDEKKRYFSSKQEENDDVSNGEDEAE